MCEESVLETDRLTSVLRGPIERSLDYTVLNRLRLSPIRDCGIRCRDIVGLVVDGEVECRPGRKGGDRLFSTSLRLFATRRLARFASFDVEQTHKVGSDSLWLRVVETSDHCCRETRIEERPSVRSFARIAVDFRRYDFSVPKSLYRQRKNGQYSQRERRGGEKRTSWNSLRNVTVCDVRLSLPCSSIQFIRR